MSSPNGQSVATVTTLDGCKTACVNDNTCLAFDYNTVNPPVCWLHNSQVNLDAKRAVADINQYILKDRCPGGKRYIIIYIVNINLVICNI